MANNMNKTPINFENSTGENDTIYKQFPVTTLNIFNKFANELTNNFKSKKIVVYSNLVCLIKYLINTY